LQLRSKGAGIPLIAAEREKYPLSCTSERRVRPTHHLSMHPTLAFAVIYPSWWAWTASVAVLLSYITGLNLGDFNLLPYDHPVWVRPMEFGLIVMAFCYDIYRNRWVIPAERA